MTRAKHDCDAALRDPGREAWWLIFQVSQSQRGPFQTACTDSDVSPAQAHLLFMLDAGEPLPMSELAEALACDNSNVTGLVDKLESRGILERRSASHDRRVKLIALTADGRALRRRLVEQFAEPPPGIAALTQGEKRALRDLLRKVAETSGGA
jgi:MarR family transcriptional regulator, organic hydroperoxide resistance regulator